jgi:cytochrome b561
VSRAAWLACSAWILFAAAVAAREGARGIGERRWNRAAARLRSPTIYLFTAYLVVAALATPHSAGESGSPLLGLGLVLPVGYALATLSAIGRERRSVAGATGLAVLHGGAVVAGAAVVLALASPAYVPAVLR